MDKKEKVFKKEPSKIPAKNQTESIQRPPLYPHAPRHYDDYIDTLIHKKDFDPIKSPQFEGAINLGVIILTIIAVKYAYISISDSYKFFMESKVIYCIIYGTLYIVGYDFIGGFLTLGSLGLYKLFLSGKITKGSLLILHYVYLAIFTIHSVWIQWDLTPVFSIVCSTILTGYLLKIHSFVLTNILLHENVKKKFEEVVGSDNRKKNSKQFQSGQESIYPSNVNIYDYLYFMYCAPSLIYETKFIRSFQIRVSYIIKQLVSFFGCCFGILCILSQFILPVVLGPRGESLVEVIYNIFSICIPSTFVWILMFYAYFHRWLNLKSELTYFGNRDFYKDWWNADCIGAFWRKWNLPMREWCLRHIYVESMYYFNTSKDVASIMVFIVSTIMNEFYLSIGFKVSQPYFFLIMITQIPLAFLSKKSGDSKRIGNTLMWISLMIGQPLVEIMYFRNWIKENYKGSISFWCH